VIQKPRAGPKRKKKESPLIHPREKGMHKREVLQINKREQRLKDAAKKKTKVASGSGVETVRDNSFRGIVLVIRSWGPL